jgi:glycolate oxidase
MIRIIEDAFHLGFPREAAALLIIEVDGPELGLDEDLAEIEQIARQNGVVHFAGGSDAARRAELWAARRKAFGAIGRVSPSYCTQDACVPRSKLPAVIAKITEICAQRGQKITNVFHAGDGNVHPILMYDENDPAEIRKALEASGEILRYCVSVGGAVTGEHGIGIEKLQYMRDMFGPDDLQAMHRIRRAMVPDDLINPYKVLPRDGVEIDLLHPRRHVPQ